MRQMMLPENIRRIANGLPYRDFVTVGLLLNKLNLKNETQTENACQHCTRLLDLRAGCRREAGADSDF